MLLVGIALALFFGDSARTVRMPLAQVTLAPVEQGVFHDLIPLRAKVVPRDTVYLDAAEGGRVERVLVLVLVEAGDIVTAGQSLIEFGNTDLQLQVIQQESQLNQAISQLQQNEIALEQNMITNARALSDIEYNIVRLTKSAARRDALAATGAASAEIRESVNDELTHYRELRPIQAESSRRQDELRARLLPAIHYQLKKSQQNLEVVRAKLDNLIVRAPVAGRVTAIDLKSGENRNPGQRLAENTPDTGYKLSADVDEFYLARVRPNQMADVDVAGAAKKVKITRIYPQVKDGRFTIDLAFVDADPAGLVGGQAVQGRLALGASRVDIFRLMLWEFNKPVLWTSLVAWPIAYFIMRHWLEGFAQRVDVGLWIFPAASLMALCIAVLTVVGHAFTIVRAEPVAALRYE